MSQYLLKLRQIPWHAEGPQRPLGRHVEHDSRSLDYLFQPRRATPIKSVWHLEHSPVLDQGGLGACTGYAAESAAGTGPLYSAIPDTVPAKPTADIATDTSQSIALYSAATRLDQFSGAYPPSDTGSTGLAAAKAMRQAGLVSGYQHATSVATAIAALMVGPLMIGIDWYSSFDDPAADGTITITRGASVRGGHELCVVGYEASGSSVNAADRLIIKNQWGTGWGVDGYCRMSVATFDALLGAQGDVTVPVPLSAPQPTPTPPPAPQPAPQPTPPGPPTPDQVDRAMWAAAQSWAKSKGLA